MVLGTGLMLMSNSEKIDMAEWMGSGVGYIFAAWICMGIMIPLRLRFEGEKARYANFILIAAVFIAAFLASKAAGYLPAETVENVKNWFYGMSAGGGLGLFAGITAAIVIISYVCSRRIRAKKEF